MDKFYIGEFGEIMDSLSTVTREEFSEVAPDFRSNHSKVTEFTSHLRVSSELNANILLQNPYNKTTTFYIGRTYDEALQVKQSGFEIDRLEQRQKNRQLEYSPGLYRRPFQSGGKLTACYKSTTLISYPIY